MPRPRHEFFAGRTKAELEREIQGLLAPYAYGEVFASALLSDLIAATHYYCAVHGLRPVEFRKDRAERGPYRFMGNFPGRGWHPVSWTACLRGRDRERMVDQGLRTEFDPETRAYLRAHPTCEQCGQRRSKETHHAAPTFQQIREAAVAALDEDGWRDVVQAVDWWSPEPYRLPRASPALAVARGLHDAARLEALCAPCHDAAHRRAG